MTEREEAQNMVNKYKLILIDEHVKYEDEILCTKIAKQISLKVCDNSLLLLENIESKINDTLIYNLKLRYNKIRTEIKNL